MSFLPHWIANFSLTWWEFILVAIIGIILFVYMTER
jgi:hypothetical protein